MSSPSTNSDATTAPKPELDAGCDVLTFRDETGCAITGLGQFNVLLRAVAASGHTLAKSLEHVQDPYLYALFGRLAGRRRQQASELARYVVEHGGQPEIDHALLAELNCIWLQLRTALFLGQSSVILDQVRENERQLMQLYDQALGTPHRPAGRQLLAEHRRALELSGALISDLRATYRPAI
ncbi:MAG: PA2169 family four-helix-bundle protein [Phycisphaeraceae bacterium]|nr:PA2169 family four-helix-bundle protein [Phycisphaeraceae bacterium]